MSTPAHSVRVLLRQGYAQLMGVPEDAFGRGGLVIEVTSARLLPEWANWMIPIWFVALGPSTTVCAVAPPCAEAVRAAPGARAMESLLRPELLDAGRQVVKEGEWTCQEILVYDSADPPEVQTPHHVRKLAPGPEEWNGYLRRFDGGVYAVCDERGGVCAHAGIKNKGTLQEIAVGVDPQFRQRGLGKAVVARAVAGILADGKLPVYVPDTLTNVGSYALATSLGLVKAGETLYWEYELPDWKGFPLAQPHS